MHRPIVGLDGQPLRKAEKTQLRQEIADAQVTGLRNIWSHGSIASGLDPIRLDRVLSNAAQGEHHEFLTLAEEMEERELHYASVLGTRKRALSGLVPTVEAASDERHDQQLAEALRELIKSPAFGDLVDDSLDALGKGYSANEIIWDQSERQWQPSQYKWRDPRFFRLDQSNGTDLLLLTDDNPFGEVLPAYKFIIHRPRLKSGLPIRGALARLAAVAYMCKSFALSNWMTFAEVFGMPIRVGKYGTNATPAEINTLRQAVANIGTDAAAIMPESMKIEFESAANFAGGDKLYDTLCEWLDRQISKGILGQTMTTDDGSSQAQANVHNEVRLDILKADARQLENTLNRDLARPYIDLNYGPQKAYPRIQLPVADPEDTAALVDALDKLIPLGLKVRMSEVRDKLNLSDPKDGDELLAAPSPASTPALPAPEPDMQAAKQPALNREQTATASQDEIDSLTDELLDNWQPQMAGIIDPLRQLLDDAQDIDEFRARLPELLEQMDASELVNQLADAGFRARALGDVDG